MSRPGRSAVAAAVAAAVATLVASSVPALAAGDGPPPGTAWRVPTALGGFAVGLTIAGGIFAATFDPFDSDAGGAGDALVVLGLPVVGGAIGYVGGRRVDRGIARGEEPSAAAKAAVRASTVIVGAGLGAAAGAWIIDHDDDSRADRDREVVWSNVGIGAVAGGLAQWWLDRHLSPATGATLGIAPARDGVAIALAWSGGAER